MPADEVADAEFSEWMRSNLHNAAGQFGLRIIGEPVFGWRLRSIGAVAAGPDGRRWLRVVTEYPQWAHGDTWTGNSDANAIPGIPKPYVIDVAEWDEQGWRRQRAEVLTLLPGEPISRTSHLITPVDLNEGWWAQLRGALRRLRHVPTDRDNTDQQKVSERAVQAFGQDLPVDAWETVHGDLHWNNLLAPRFALLDWELWGRGPAGTDAASLLLHSLLVPPVADKIRSMFADQLDTDTGRHAQLAVAARLHSRITRGDYPELAVPLRHHVHSLGATLASS